MIRPFIKLICLSLSILLSGVTSAASSESKKRVRINLHTLGTDNKISDQIMEAFHQARKDNASMSKILTLPQAKPISPEELNSFIPQIN